MFDYIVWVHHVHPNAGKIAFHAVCLGTHSSNPAFNG